MLEDYEIPLVAVLSIVNSCNEMTLNNFWDSFYSRAWGWGFEMCGLQARTSVKIKLDIIKYIHLIFGA